MYDPKRIDIAGIDLIKDEKLPQILLGYNFINEFKYFEVINSVLGWKID